MKAFRHGMTTLLMVATLSACTSEKPTTDDHVLKGQVESMEKARQVENVMNERVESLQQQIENPPSSQ